MATLFVNVLQLIQVVSLFFTDWNKYWIVMKQMESNGCDWIYDPTNLAYHLQPLDITVNGG